MDSSLNRLAGDPPVLLSANDKMADSDLESPSFTPSVMPGITPPTLYMPIESPPTPAPSPRPSNTSFVLPDSFSHIFSSYDPAHLSRREFSSLAALNPSVRRQYLASLLGDCTPSELLFISTTIAPLLKRDFLKELPPEIAMHILSFVHDPKTLCRASQVSRKWKTLLSDEWLWKKMCERLHFDDVDPAIEQPSVEEDDDNEPLEEMERFAMVPMDPALEWLTAKRRLARKEQKSKAKASTPASPKDCASLLAHSTDARFSYRKHFKHTYCTMMNWRHGGRLLRAHRVPVSNPDNGVITSVALDAHWVVAGLANSKIHIFSAKTGVLSRTLIGHEQGVWAVNLVSRGGHWADQGVPSRLEQITRPKLETERGRNNPSIRGRKDQLSDHSYNFTPAFSAMSMNEPGEGSSPTLSSLDHSVLPSLRIALGLDMKRPRTPSRRRRRSSPEQMFNEQVLKDIAAELEKGTDSLDPGKRSDICFASEGWGQPNALVVSGGCDKVLRVWDVNTGYCIYVLHGHSSTIRCIRVLHNRPIAVTGSRDSTLRVWDVQRGQMLKVLEGHQQSVRCLDICGNKAVSGSYDTTCRLWDVDTGECLHILRGHFHQIYSVAFDGVRVASGGLDTTVRVWDATSGHCLALLQGHTALVCQLQLSPTILATGGSDGRVITFSLSTFKALQRIAAHDSSVTSLQFDKQFLVTGGNDGRVRLFETKSGNYVRDLSEPSDSVWKVVYRKDACAIMCKRASNTVMEIWTFKPSI